MSEASDLHPHALPGLKGRNQACVRPGELSIAYAGTYTARGKQAFGSPDTPITRLVYARAYTSRQTPSDRIVPLRLPSGYVWHRIRNQMERQKQYLWFLYAT